MDARPSSTLDDPAFVADGGGRVDQRKVGEGLSRDPVLMDGVARQMAKCRVWYRRYLMYKYSTLCGYTYLSRLLRYREYTSNN